MHPSNSSHNGNDDLLISYPDQAFSYKPFSIDSNPTSKQETNFALPPPPPLFHFPPSLFEDNEIFLQQQLLHHHHHDHHHGFLLHQQSLADAVVNNMEVSINKVPARGGGHGMMNTEVIQMPRRRSCKRDRHSKIKTARGLRDRRMRLSLEVAKKFFGLQDLLGFDKASKTVEWLLNQSKVEIKQLAREKKKNLNHQTSCNNSAVNIAAAGGGGAKSASSTSECEGVSSLDEVAVSGNIQEQDNKGKPVIPPAVVKRRINKLISRKSAFFHPLAREFREKARERARERTREKMRTRRALAADHDESKQCSEATINHDLMRNQSQSLNNLSLDVMAEAEKPSSQAKEHLGTVEDMPHDDDSLATMMSKWSPSMIFNSLNNPGLLQEHQFAGFQTLGKPWEAYNSHI